MNRTAVSLFNKTEEVKVSVHCEPRVMLFARASGESGWVRLYRCIRRAQKDFECGKHEFTCSSSFGSKVRGLRVIGSSEQVHVVDALAITGDEGRSSLR